MTGAPHEEHRTTSALQRRFYLHIGAPKTATTYLQDLLWRNRATLMSDGILLPGSGPNDHFRAGFDIRDAQRHHLDPGERWDGAFDHLVREAEESDCPTSLISDERLAGATPEQIERVFDRLADFDVHVIYGIRDFAGLLPSEWQQTVKHGNKRSFERWLSDISLHRPTDWFWRAHDVEHVLTRWQPDDPARVRVITTPPPDSPDDEVWRRLARTVGWTSSTDTGHERSNQSLGYVEATLMSRFQGAIPPGTPGPQREWIMRQLVAAELLSDRPSPSPILIPEAHRDWIEREAESRRAFLAASGFDIVGDIDELATSDRRFGEVTTDGREPEMLDAAVGVVGELVARLARETVRADELHAQLAAQHAEIAPEPNRCGRAWGIIEDAAHKVRRYSDRARRVRGGDDVDGAS